MSNGTPVKVKASSPLRSDFTTSIGPSRGSIALWGGRSATYEQIVFTQPWVYAAVRTFYLAISRLPDKVYTGLETTDRARTRDHDLARLIRSPWPNASAWDRKGELAYNLISQGNHLEMKVRPGVGAPPTELWPIPWTHVQEIKDGLEVIGYSVHLNGKTFPLAPDDVVRYRLMGGKSPLEAARRTLGIEDAAMDWQKSALERGPAMRGVFTSEKSLKQDVMDRLRLELEKLYSGPEGKSFFLSDSSFEFKPINMSSSDAGIIDARKLSREEVAAIFGIPAPMIGILDHATYSNITELRSSFYVDTIAPYLKLIEDSMQTQLIDKEPSWQKDGVFVEFDMGDILKPDPLAEAQSLVLLMNSGTTSANENRKFKNLPPIGDPNDQSNPFNRPRVPANLVDPEVQQDLAAAQQAKPVSAEVPELTKKKGKKNA